MANLWKLIAEELVQLSAGAGLRPTVATRVGKLRRPEQEVPHEPRAQTKEQAREGAAESRRGRALGAENAVGADAHQDQAHRNEQRDECAERQANADLHAVFEAGQVRRCKRHGVGQAFALARQAMLGCNGFLVDRRHGCRDLRFILLLHLSHRQTLTAEDERRFRIDRRRRGTEGVHAQAAHGKRMILLRHRECRHRRELLLPGLGGRYDGRCLLGDVATPAVRAEEALQHCGRFGAVVQDDLGLIEVGAAVDFVHQQEMGRQTARLDLKAVVHNAGENPGGGGLAGLITSANPRGRFAAGDEFR